ncbi:MAG: DUF58 domain-containing protein [Thermoguttaceae bacterium]|jgi:uncharacterized protein (DUF58 family)|nr:DUF58 domain-containing protein [Thermoguttaceae bacterium]
MVAVAKSILSRYIDPVVLSRIARRRIEPRGLVLGNLAGAHKSPLSGFAVEFAGHREYVWGDDPKHIDWRVYFTRQRYMIKQYEMETNFVCHLVLDVSASMRYGDGAHQKLRYAAQMAATLAYAIVRQSDKVSLATFDEKVLGFVPPSNSMAQIVRLTEHLDQIEPVHKTNMADCLNELTGRMRRREIVMILSDFFTELAPLEAAIQRMRYHRHEVVLFQVMHHDELDFPFDGMVKFVGLEVPEELLTQPEELRREYLAAVNRHNAELEALCQRNRAERVLVDTSRDMGQVFADYLNLRSRLLRHR